MRNNCNNVENVHSSYEPRQTIPFYISLMHCNNCRKSKSDKIETKHENRLMMLREKTLLTALIHMYMHGTCQWILKQL